MNILLKRLFFCFWVAIAMSLCSCSDNDYVNCIPSTSTALVKIDAQKVNSPKLMAWLKGVIGVGDKENSGIDFSSPVYLFETVDGNFGLCAKVKDSDDLTDFFNSSNGEVRFSRVRKVGDISFTDINESWCVGYTSKSFVAVGPVAVSALADTRRVISRLLMQNAERSIVDKPMYSRIDTMSSAVSLVAQAQALPDKFVAPITIGAPKEADVSQIFVEANVGIVGKTLLLEGKTFSFNKSIDKSIQNSQKLFRPIGERYNGKITESDVFGISLNVDGDKFLPLLQNNKYLQSIMVGMNTAVDFDNIMRSVDGPMMVTSKGFSDNNMSLAMLADVKSTPSWISDVDYWKRSCPSGSKIIDNGTNSWIYASGNSRLYFGLRDNEFYASSENPDNFNSAIKSEILLSHDLLLKMQQSRMAIVLNLSALLKSVNHESSVSDSLLDGIHSILFLME